MKHQAFMLAAAEESEGNLIISEGGPFGAVIVKDGKIVGRGHNQVLVNHDPTCHGEIQAIRDACKKLATHDLTGCELYASCYPCPMCLSAAIWANIKTVYYGNTSADANAIGFRNDFIYQFIEGKCKDASVLHLKQIYREKTLKAFQQFKQKSDTTND